VAVAEGCLVGDPARLRHAQPLTAGGGLSSSPHYAWRDFWHSYAGGAVMLQTATPADTARPNPQERIADVITAFCGNMLFVYVHIAIFAVWIASRGFGSDHYPFNFLTMAVSLEAIFLSTFILISQNRQQAIAEANNRAVQDTLLHMVNNVIDDEKLDHANETMIQELLNRIDVEHIQPMEVQIAGVAEAVARIERKLAR
jgi:uncharacterized membrane protein